VFLAAGAFAWRAFGPAAEIGLPVVRGSWPVATVSFSVSGDGDRVATLALGGSSQTGVIGASTSVDEPYPYAWLNPSMPTIEDPLEIPMGSELRLEGEVGIKELLYGDAQQLDEGAGPDSGPIWADQPDFSEPYFLPWDDEPERTYLKFFGTWADGQVLDVYFEVVFVEPDADFTDPTAEIVVTPDPMGAVFLYGGQRSPMGIEGGTYGNMSIVGDFAEFDEDAIVVKVPAGTSLEIGGALLVDASVHAGPLPFGEAGTALNGAIPAETGRYVLRTKVTWDGGSATFLHQIQVVPAPGSRESPVTGNESPSPASPGSVVVDIRGRSSEEGPDPGATARFGDQEVRMCPDHWTLVNPDGTEESVIFDCGQSDVFQAPVGTPIEVIGDFATLNVSVGVTGNRLPGTGEAVPPLEPGTIITLAYEVTWEDGSEASFWLLLTVQDTEPTTEEPGIIVHVYGIGERSYAEPTATFSFAGKTKVACTQDYEWTRGDGTTISEEMPDTSACAGRAIEVPPGTSIAIQAATTTRVFTTRATTQFFEGDVGLVVSAEWAEGNATFVVPLTVAEATPDLELVVLDCRPEDRVEFTGPDERILPGGSAFIVGNLPGFERSDIVEQMTRTPEGDTEWSGVWQVVRDGDVVAAVDWDALSGTACRGSGIGGT
jgi:hypothetical protein